MASRLLATKSKRTLGSSRLGRHRGACKTAPPQLATISSRTTLRPHHRSFNRPALRGRAHAVRSQRNRAVQSQPRPQPKMMGGGMTGGTMGGEKTMLHPSGQHLRIGRGQSPAQPGPKPSQLRRRLMAGTTISRRIGDRVAGPCWLCASNSLC